MSVSCIHKTPKNVIGQLLSAHYGIKSYSDFDQSRFATIFVRTLDSLYPELKNPKTIGAFYANRGYRPRILLSSFEHHDLDTLIRYLKVSSDHGFSPENFHLSKIRHFYGTLENHPAHQLEQAYSQIAKLEILSSDAYVHYVNNLRYGITDPAQLFSKYRISLGHSSRTTIFSLLGGTSLPDTLRLAQPSSEKYRSLQAAMIRSGTDSATYRTLAVNLERLRWKMPDLGKTYIQVNIPDLRLVWISGMDTLTSMKVCVGGKRSADYVKKIERYLKTRRLEDLPENHETPMLLSHISGIERNPVWNIPQSIAKSEIYWMARKDPFYLNRHHFQVLLKGKPVSSGNINWHLQDRSRMNYSFRQASGNSNALGKLKFVLANAGGIYLHDTNNRSAFSLSDRSISHGCVRLEKPMVLARLLMDNPRRFEEMKNSRTESAVYGTRAKIPLLITYLTAWPEHNVIQFRPDVYGLDEILWKAMTRYNRS